MFIRLESEYKKSRKLRKINMKINRKNYILSIFVKSIDFMEKVIVIKNKSIKLFIIISFISCKGTKIHSLIYSQLQNFFLNFG